MRRLLTLLTMGTILSSVLILFRVSRNAVAMPMFARKLNVDCSTCHTIIPRLNATGYKFRAAGFRMPETIGEPETKKFELGDYVSGRLQARYDANRSQTTGLVSSHNNRLSFHEVTLYPATGAWGRNFGSLFELSIAPEEPTEIENAYLRYTRGREQSFFEARVGIFHPFEGYGASDRPIAISRPFIQTNGANFNQKTFFTPWNFDQAGAEVGYEFRRTSVRAMLFNGVVLKDEDGVLTPFAAQGGSLSKPTGFPAHNTPDFQFFANQQLTEDGGALSFYYYRGNLALPTNGMDATGGFFRNNFDRVALYGSYPVAKPVLVLAGYQWGRDHVVAGTTFNSRGLFAEADFPLGDYVAPGVRYDQFDPATNKSNNNLWGVTTFVNVPLQNGVQFIAEYQHKNTEISATQTKKDDSFQVRFIFIL